MLLHHLLFEEAKGIFSAPGRQPSDVAFDVVALGSATAGALLVLVAVALASELVTRKNVAREEDGQEAMPRASRLLVGSLILAQGYIQLCFGYVENYTYFTLALALYVLTGLRVMDGRTPLIVSSLALALVIALNISGIVLLPSWLILAVLCLARRSSRSSAVRDVVATIVVFLGLDRVLVPLGGGREATGGLRYIWDLVVHGSQGSNSLQYLLSVEHWRDFFNIHMIIGPFAAFLLVPLAALYIGRPGQLTGRHLFLLCCALPALATSWLFGDPLQGFPRDWDLFAPFALLYTVAGVEFLLSRSPTAGQSNRLLAVAIIVSLFHTIPWIALNTSEQLALERYKTFPLSRGRAEAVVGHWYMKHGQTILAKEWLTKAVTANPGNNAAHYHLGLYAMDERRHEDALQHFRVATQVRPDVSSYRLGLVDALVVSGRTPDALPELKRLIEGEPRRANLWACLGVALVGVGRIAEGRAALERAQDLAPLDSLYVKLAAGIGEPGGFRRAIQEDWAELVTR